MNILITCPGRAIGIVSILKSEFAAAGFGTIVTAHRNIIPALYAADKAYIVPPISDPGYIPRLLEICGQDQVKAIFTLMDEEVTLLAQAAPQFRAAGIFPLVVDYEAARTCDDKYLMYQFLVEHGFKCATTYTSLEEFQAAHARHEVDFPVFVKPVIGAATRGAMKCQTMDEIALNCSLTPNLIIQEFLDGPEYSIEVYMDTISKKMVSVFAKGKIIKTNVGIGGTATGITIKNERLFAQAEQLAQSLGAIGPLNIEVFDIDGEYYVGEVNPRFGGNYMFAHLCGVDFGRLIVNNINGIENPPRIGEYDEDVLMLRYDEMIVKSKEDML